MVKDSNRLQVPYGMMNPTLLQPNSREEYSTLNHTGGQKVLNHFNGESTTDSQQYAKLNVGNQLD